MSNTIYEDKLFNENIKEEYMADMKKGTRAINSRIFKVSYPLEQQLGKDLYDFNLDELSKLFYLFRPATKQSSAGNCGYVHKYLDFCLERGYKTGLNPLDLVSPQWKQMFANVEMKRFWTDKELDKVINSRENAQDAILIELLRSGVRGSGNSEILNLNKRSIDGLNNQLHLEDDNGTKRTITVSDKCIKLCGQALRETEYSKMNGNASPDIKSPMAQLVDSDFILRNANTRTVHMYESDKSTVHRRLSKIEEELGLNSFTPIAISRSGMLSMAKDRILDHGELTDEDLIEIAIQFGENSDNAVYRLKMDFLNESTVKDLYKLP